MTVIFLSVNNYVYVNENFKLVFPFCITGSPDSKRAKHCLIYAHQTEIKVSTVILTICCRRLHLVIFNCNTTVRKNKCFKISEKSNDIEACYYDQLTERVFLQNIRPLTLKVFFSCFFFFLFLTASFSFW